MVQLRIDRSILSYTLYNICDVLGTGYTCVCRPFDKRRNNRKEKKVRKGSNKLVVLSRGCSIFQLTVFHICDVSGTGCTCICRGFDNKTKE